MEANPDQFFCFITLITKLIHFDEVETEIMNHAAVTDLFSVP